MTIKAITFDFWQTLYKNQPIDFNERLHFMQAELAQHSGQNFSIDVIRSAVIVARDTWSKTWAEEHRTLSAEDWLGIMLAELGLSLPAPKRQAIAIGMENSILKRRPQPVEEAQAVLAELATRYRLGLISDTGITPGRVLRQILVEDNLADYFIWLTFSDEIGRSKPHPDAFLITLTALNTDPAHAVHVGDLLRTDIIGAQSVGMRGVQYVGITRDDWSMSLAYPLENPVTPDAVINNHTELLPLLKCWNGSA